MSLDFYLTHNTGQKPCVCACGHEHTANTSETVASFNITHNLGSMADVAGIYECLWRPDEQVPPITIAGECVSTLRDGLAKLRAEPDKFRPLSASNGWGTYDQFVPWVAEVLAACEANPTALVSVSR